LGFHLKALGLVACLDLFMPLALALLVLQLFVISFLVPNGPTTAAIGANHFPIQLLSIGEKDNFVRSRQLIPIILEFLLVAVVTGHWHCSFLFNGLAVF